MLDLGCGTGLSGVALKEAGFTTIDGTDFAADMMAKAAEKEGVYRTLIQGDLNRPLPAEPGQYTNMAAIGVFSPHHAPASMIETVVNILPVGGCFVFSLNDHGMKDPSYGGKVQELAAAGVVEKVTEEYGRTCRRSILAQRSTSCGSSDRPGRDCATARATEPIAERCPPYR